MDVSEFVFRTGLIFIPGIVAVSIVNGLTYHKKFEFFEVVVDSIVLGLVCYVFYFLILKVPCFNSTPRILDELTDAKSKVDLDEIFVVSVLAIPVGLFWSFALNRKWLHRFSRRIGVSNKFGDLDVWSYLMNNSEDIDPWIHIRDLEFDLIYSGYIEAFEDSSDERGIFLVDVTVYRNSTGKKLYQTPGMYLARDRNKMVVDFPRLSR